MPEFPPLDGFQLAPSERIYLGMDSSDGHRPLWAGPRESVGIIGPPGYGKTSGLIVPQVLAWSGPAVVTSTRSDVLMATGNHRRALAAPLGDVYVYDPFGSDPRVTTMRWSPLDRCADPSVAYRRVGEMVAARGAKGVEGGDHFAAGAARILRGLFHCAALHGRDLEAVLGWLGQGSFDEPVNLLRAAAGSSPAALPWATALESMRYKGERERGSFVSVAENVLDAVADPRVLASTRNATFEVDAFLNSRSTLYIIGPLHYQAALAPMAAGLVASIAERALERAAATPNGVLNPRLGLFLDEVSNIAPISSLAGLASAGAGSGVVTVWAAQSLDALRDRFGEATTAAVWGASTVKVTYGGIANDGDLRMISGWAGERRTPRPGVHAGGASVGAAPFAPGLGGGVIGAMRAVGGVSDRAETASRSHSVSQEWRPVLPVDALRRTREGHAWVWHRSDAPLLAETRPAGLVDEFAALGGYTSGVR